MKTVVTFSGGKDSQASLIWAANEFGSKNLEVVFCDTGWEHPKTYNHIRSVVDQMGLTLTVLKSKKYKGMVDLAKEKKRFPSIKARFCTEELKSKPMIDYILDQVNGDCLILQGIRKDESEKRSLMDKQCTYFKFYFESYGYDKKGKPKYHTYRKDDVIAFCSKYCHDILRPVFNWTGKEVIDYIVNNGQQPNPLYYEGFKRVGCFPCIMCTHQEVKQINLRYPESLDRLEKIEKDLNSTFFNPNYIPERYRSQKTIDKTGQLKTFPTTGDVRKYVNDKNATLDMFSEPTSCMSFYGVCE